MLKVIITRDIYIYISTHIDFIITDLDLSAQMTDVTIHIAEMARN